MKLTQEIIDKIQEAMNHTKKDGSINWKDDDEIVVQLAGTFAADRFIVIKNKTKDPVVSAAPHPDFDYLEGSIIDQIEILAEELDGTVRHLKKCNSVGRKSKVIEIEYNIEEPTL